MTKAERKEFKNRILDMVRRSGVPVRTQSILRRVKSPENTDLTPLLAELVMEGHLLRRPTLLVNGEVGYIYDIPPTA